MKLKCICGSPHSLEFKHYTMDDWEYMIQITCNHASFWEKVKYLFKTDFMIDDIIVEKEQILELKEWIDEKEKTKLGKTLKA